MVVHLGYRMVVGLSLYPWLPEHPEVVQLTSCLLLAGQLLDSLLIVSYSLSLSTLCYLPQSFISLGEWDVALIDLLPSL